MEDTIFIFLVIFVIFLSHSSTFNLKMLTFPLINMYIYNEVFLLCVRIVQAPGYFMHKMARAQRSSHGLLGFDAV